MYLGYKLTLDGISYEAGSGDYAEYLIQTDSPETISHGKIVGVRTSKISKSLIKAERFMAISTAPAMSGAILTPNSCSIESQNHLQQEEK